MSPPPRPTAPQGEYEILSTFFKTTPAFIMLNDSDEGVFSKRKICLSNYLTPEVDTYRVTQKLPQICTVILRVCIGKVA